jgi:DHA1 family tetracycline resistance protein-like MFS transporter
MLMEMPHNSPRKQFYTILLIVFLGFLGISMPYLIFPALFLNPAYSILPETWSTSSHAILLGVTLAAYPFGQFIGSPILGALSDDYGRKRLLSGSLVVAALCNFLTGLALDWEMLSLVIFSRFAAGIMEGNVAIARAMAADIKSISKHETFGKINAAASIAFLIGPLMGGLLADDKIIDGLTVSSPFYFISFLFLGLSVLSIIIIQIKDPIPLISSESEIQRIWSRFNLIKKLSILFQNKRLRFLMLVSTFFTLAIDVFYEFAPVYLTAKWTLGPVELVSYNSVLCVALAIGNGWLASYFSKHYSSRRGIIGSMGGLALFLIGTVLTDQPILMIMLFLFSGLVIGLGVTLITVKISDSVSDSIQGEVMGTQLSLRVLGDAVICLLGGVLLLLSPKIILILAAIISAATAVYFATKEKKLKNHYN